MKYIYTLNKFLIADWLRNKHSQADFLLKITINFSKLIKGYLTVGRMYTVVLLQIV